MKGRPALYVGRTLWVLGLVLVAVLATGLQLDRTARKDIRLARMVPPVFRAYALEPLASQAYASNRVARGLGYSRDLVRRRPIPAEGLALLTRGLVVAGDENAVGALVLSAQRGWRSTFTQILIVNSALSAGDTQTAAQRVLALWRLRRKNPEVGALTAALLSSDSGQDAFAAGLVREDSWLDDFLQWAVAQRVPSRAFAVAGSALADKRATLDCPRLANSARVLTRSGRPQEARLLWARLCASGAAATAPGDLAFQQEGSLPSPFGWIYPEQGQLTTEIVGGEDGKALRYDNRAHVLAELARRVAVLKPGMHSVRIETSPTDSLSADPVVLQITCHANDDTAQKPVRIWVRQDPVAFTIPGSGCVGQELALLAGYGKGLIRQISMN